MLVFKVESTSDSLMDVRCAFANAHIRHPSQSYMDTMKEQIKEIISSATKKLDWVNKEELVSSLFGDAND